jgi:hypothetical protein
MGEDASDFREALVDWVESGPPPGDHPGADRWLAYQRGELAADEEERLQEHLVRCRDCCDLAQAAAAFAAADGELEAGEAVGEAGEGDAVAQAALWRQVRPPAEVREITSGSRTAPAGRLEPPRAGRGFRLPAALAASLLVALGGLAAWNLQQRSALERLRAPRADAPIFDFSGGERLTGREERTIAAGGPWMLVFHPADELPVYRLTVREAASGRQVLAADLRPDGDLALTLHLPEGLPPGRYRMEIGDPAGLEGGAGQVLEEHLLRVTGEGGG